MPRYSIEFTPAAERDLRKLARADRRTLRRVDAAIQALRTEPRPAGVRKLSGGDDYRIRVGDYRILYTIVDAVLVVCVIRVRDRKDVYGQR
ncbi:MAG: type II toxin-antitoxin system RelE/ParE family toxin [bacterium]|nr:type II toxin-antitoxin system RelE/ParE family toxin [bacterium]